LSISADARAYAFDDTATRIDRDVVWTFLSGQAYWGRWRGREVVDRQIDASWRVVGCYRHPTGAMVGFARAISDGLSVAYLADVFMLPECRGMGLGTRLVEVMIDQGPGAHFRWMLHTNDAHGLYAKAGFRRPDHTYLERPGHAPAASTGPGALVGRRPAAQGHGPVGGSGGRRAGVLADALADDVRRTTHPARMDAADVLPEYAQRDELRRGEDRDH
jgi:GNAT superfamily N-acetyltransferase